MQIRNFSKFDQDTGDKTWSGIQLMALAKSRRHHFSPVWLERHIARGFVSMTDSSIVLHTIDGDMLFKIDHVPSRYCLHCGEKLHNEEDDAGGMLIRAGDSRLGAEAREHVKKKHTGKKSMNPSFPSGYKFKHYYGATADESVPTVNPKAKQISRLVKVEQRVES